MGAVTYPDADVQRVIEEKFVPVKFDVVEQPDSMDRFHTPWTPTLIVEDAEGVEHRRSQGYLDPRRFLAEMAMAQMKDAVDRRDYPEAERRSAAALAATGGDPERHPEAIYWSAVAAYKASGDPARLLAGWNRLLDDFAGSEWARKVEFIRMG